MSHIDYQGHKVWYRESGAGDPLVFLHNGGNDHRIWDHQVLHFSKHHRVIVVDHLGHGNSDRPSLDYTLPLFTGQVAALVEQLSLAPVTLVGHCIGAAMSLNYTLQNPANVHRRCCLTWPRKRRCWPSPSGGRVSELFTEPGRAGSFLRRDRSERPAARAD